MELTRIFLIISSVVFVTHSLLWWELNNKLNNIHPLAYHGHVIWLLRKKTPVRDMLGYYYYWTLRHPYLSEWPCVLVVVTLLLDIFV